VGRRPSDSASHPPQRSTTNTQPNRHLHDSADSAGSIPITRFTERTSQTLGHRHCQLLRAMLNATTAWRLAPADILWPAVHDGLRGDHAPSANYSAAHELDGARKSRSRQSVLITSLRPGAPRTGTVHDGRGPCGSARHRTDYYGLSALATVEITALRRTHKFLPLGFGKDQIGPIVLDGSTYKNRLPFASHHYTRATVALSRNTPASIS